MKAAVAGFAGVLLMLVVLAAGLGSDEPAAAPGPGGALDTTLVPARYRQAVIAAGTHCPAIASGLIAAQIKTESNWDESATSAVGARGPAQFMPGTWATWGTDYSGDGRAAITDIADAVGSQADYMCHLAGQVQTDLGRHRITGDPTALALAAYNAGPGAVEDFGGIPPFAQTQDYVAQILALLPTYQQIAIPPGGGKLGRRIVAAAEQMLGTPYLLGGGGPTGPTGGGIDCSGLTLYAVYQATGEKLTLPHYTGAQLTDPRLATVPVTHANTGHVLKPGDLIFFNVPTDPAPWGHVGIYLGGGQMIHAPQPGDAVKISPIRTAYWMSMAWQARRVQH